MGITEEATWTTFGRLMLALGGSDDVDARMQQEKADKNEDDDGKDSIFPAHACEALDELARKSHVGELHDASMDMDRRLEKLM